VWTSNRFSYVLDTRLVWSRGEVEGDWLRVEEEAQLLDELLRSKEILLTILDEGKRDLAHLEDNRKKGESGGPMRSGHYGGAMCRCI